MKHFSKQTVFEAHKTGKKHLKATAEYQKNPEKFDQLAQQTNKNQSSRSKEIAKHEFIITKYLELLKSVREDTRAFVNSKLLMTERERVIMIIVLLV
jgi:splicing factor 3A subunit 3